MYFSLYLMVNISSTLSAGTSRVLKCMDEDNSEDQLSYYHRQTSLTRKFVESSDNQDFSGFVFDVL